MRVAWVRCDAATSSVATCGPGHTNNWQWSEEAIKCGAHRLAQPDAQALLQEKWVVVVGDSIGRFFFAAMLRLVNPEGCPLHPCISLAPSPSASSPSSSSSSQVVVIGL